MNTQNCFSIQPTHTHLVHKYTVNDTLSLLPGTGLPLYTLTSSLPAVTITGAQQNTRWMHNQDSESSIAPRMLCDLGRVIASLLFQFLGILPIAL